MGPKFYDQCPSKKRDPETDRHPRSSPCDDGVELGGMWPKAKDCLQPPEAGRGQEGSSPEPSEGRRPHRHLGFLFPASILGERNL